MRRYFIYYTAIFFLFSSTELHELVRLPLLITHYFHHSHSNREMGLTGFIRLHYTGEHPADQDDGEDRQLPFKTQNDGLKPEITNTIFPGPLTAICIIPAEQPSSFYPEGIPLHRAYCIFHPPRSAAAHT